MCVEDVSVRPFGTGELSEERVSRMAVVGAGSFPYGRTPPAPSLALPEGARRMVENTER